MRGLQPGTCYYFGLKTADDTLNWSGISNIDTATTEAYESSGPHAYGVLIAHLNPVLGYTSAPTSSYEGFSDLAHCHDAITAGDILPEYPQIWFVIASFDNSPGPIELMEVQFGFADYDPAGICLVDYSAPHNCVLELSSSGWPGPQEGTCIVFDSHTLPTSPLVELYWFASYVYSPVSIELGPNPDTGHATFGGNLLHNYLPPTIDKVYDFGIMGFGKPGYNPCAQ